MRCYACSTRTENPALLATSKPGPPLPLCANCEAEALALILDLRYRAQIRLMRP